MNKKITLPSIIIILLLITTLIPTTTSQDLQQIEELRVFYFDTTTNVTIEEIDALKNPILPGASFETDVNIKFKFELPDLFPSFLIGTKIGNWIMFRDMNQDMSAEIKLSVESPEWCKVKLEEEKITVTNYTYKYIDPVTTKLNITLKTGAEALDNGTIKITASFISPEKWGLNSSEGTLEKTITVDYLPAIKIEIENQTVQIKPLKTNYIPLNITNNGNGKTTVKTKIKNTPENWTISFNESDTELEIGETKFIQLNVTSIKKFDIETIKLEFTPELTQNSDYQGDIISLQISLKNDGSLEDGIIDTTLLIIILIIILLVILVGWIIFKRRYQ